MVQFLLPPGWGGTLETGEFLDAIPDKSRYVAQVFASIEAIAGTLAPASYVVVQEVHADAWGYQGQTQEFRYVRGKVP